MDAAPVDAHMNMSNDDDAATSVRASASTGSRAMIDRKGRVPSSSQSLVPGRRS